MIIRSGPGNSPWDVLHQGLGRTFGGGTGMWSIVVGGLVLVAWLPLKQRPGLGTAGNVVVIGLVLDATLAVMGSPEAPAGRAALLAAGILLNRLATGLYIGAAFGAGPRDGLMIGLAARRVSIRAARTGIEVGVLVAGILLGGTFGVGTLAYAVAIGPLAHRFIPMFSARPSPVAATAAA